MIFSPEQSKKLQELGLDLNLSNYTWVKHGKIDESGKVVLDGEDMWIPILHNYKHMVGIYYRHQPTWSVTSVLHLLDDSDYISFVTKLSKTKRNIVNGFEKLPDTIREFVYIRLTNKLKDARIK